MDWILDNILTICAMSLPASATIGVSFYRKRLNRKRLSYNIIYEDEIVKRGVDYEGLKFSYNDKEVNDLYLIVVKVINDGRRTISSDDFESFLEFYFKNDEKILNIEMFNKKPSNIDIDFSINDQSIIINPTLLNVKDEFSIRILITNSNKINLGVKSRIKGIKSITKSRKRKTPLHWLYYEFNFICILAILMCAFSIFTGYKVNLLWIFQGSFILFILIVFKYIIISKKSKTAKKTT